MFWLGLFLNFITFGTLIPNYTTLVSQPTFPPNRSYPSRRKWVLHNRSYFSQSDQLSLLLAQASLESVAILSRSLKGLFYPPPPLLSTFSCSALIIAISLLCLPMVLSYSLLFCLGVLLSTNLLSKFDLNTL